MTLPASGLITMDQIRTELGGGASDIDLGATLPRLLARKETGAISMTDFYGKSCSVYTLNVNTHESPLIDVGFVEQPTSIAPNESNAGSISPTDLFRSLRMDVIATGSAGGNHFKISMPSDASNPPELYQSPGLYYAVNINGYTFYETDAVLGGEGGGRTIYTWSTPMTLNPGQSYTLRIFY